MTITLPPELEKKARSRATKEHRTLSEIAELLFADYAMGRWQSPRQILTKNGLTPEEEAEILQASAEAKMGINVFGPFNNAEEMIAHLNKDIEE